MSTGRPEANGRQPGLHGAHFFPWNTCRLWEGQSIPAAVVKLKKIRFMQTETGAGH